MEPASVRVRGHGVAQARPDRVQVRITVRALLSQPDAALDEAALRLAEVQTVLDGEGVAATDRLTEGLSVREAQEWVEGRAVHRGWVASASTVVTTVEPAVVGRLLRRVVEVSGAEVAGPWWQVAPDNPAWLEACRLAAEEARRKAEAYAGALGLRLGAVVSVAEPDGEDRPEPRPMALAAARSRAAEPELEAGDLEVRAGVEVTFRLEP